MAIITADKVALLLALLLVDGVLDVAGAVVPEESMGAMVGMSVEVLLELGGGHSGRLDEMGVTPALNEAGGVLERLDSVEREDGRGEGSGARSTLLR